VNATIDPALAGDPVAQQRLLPDFLRAAPARIPLEQVLSLAVAETSRATSPLEPEARRAAGGPRGGLLASV
jgi:hypothetical protein